MGRPKTKKMSAKDFREPVLQALGELTDYTPDKSVPFQEVNSVVLSMMDLKEDSFGIQKASGRPWVIQWIGWAFRYLKNNDLGFSPRRGYWGLTSQGVYELKDREVIKPPPKKAKKTSPVGIHDEQLLIAAGKSRKCWAKYYEKSPQCSQCLSASLCREERNKNLEEASRILVLRDQLKVTREDLELMDDHSLLTVFKKVSRSGLMEEEEIPPLMAGAQKVIALGGTISLSTKESICIQCVESITPNLPVATKNSDSYHITCFVEKYDR